MTEQEIHYEEPTLLKDNPSYATVRREELQLEGGTKKPRVSDRWMSASALVVAATALVVAVVFAAITKSDCSCNEGAATQIAEQVNSVRQIRGTLAGL